MKNEIFFNHLEKSFVFNLDLNLMYVEIVSLLTPTKDETRHNEDQDSTYDSVLPIKKNCLK